MAGAKAGDQKGFSGLFQAHGGRVYALSLRLLGSVGAAEKLTRDIFLDVFSNLDAISDDAAFSGHLYRSAAKTVLVHRLNHKSVQTSVHRTRVDRHHSIVIQNR